MILISKLLKAVLLPIISKIIYKIKQIKTFKMFSETTDTKYFKKEYLENITTAIAT